MLDKITLKTFELQNFSEILCHGHILEQQSFSDGIMKYRYMKILQVCKVHKFFSV